ncbi:MAG: hypothetical protein WC087_03955 [Candidatus Paceibacterota bacterium]
MAANDIEKTWVSEDPEFERDMLACRIMLDQAERGNTVSYEDACTMALALMREDEELPLHLLRPKSVAA